MSTPVLETPPASTGDAPSEPAPPASSTPPDAPSVTPSTPPPDPPEPATPELPLESVTDFGDGPDGDPVAGEDQVAKLKRIGRREAREKREMTTALTGERDQAITRAETAELALAEAQPAAVELAAVKGTLAERDLTLLRYTVGSTKNLTMDQASRLKGGDQQAIEADLERFLSENAMPVPASRAETRDDRKAFLDKMNRNRY